MPKGRKGREREAWRRSWGRGECGKLFERGKWEGYARKRWSKVCGKGRYSWVYCRKGREKNRHAMGRVREVGVKVKT